MNNTTLQVPINKDLREKAEDAAERMGFSSLQEIVRLFLIRVASGEIVVNFEPVVRLSPKNDKRYSKMIAEIESGKVEVKTFSDVSALMDDLSK